MAFVDLNPTRDLQLIKLYQDGLTALGLSRESFIEVNSKHYVETARWAGALHAVTLRVDGLLWFSRLHPESKALVLFGDRVQSNELRQLAPALPLGVGRGLDLVREIANALDITIVEP